MNHNRHLLSHESGLNVLNLLLLSEYYEKCPEYAIFLNDPETLNDKLLFTL